MQLEQVRASLWSLPCDERCAMLACSIIENNKRSPTIPLRGFAKLIVEMSQYLSRNQRFEVTEFLRDYADVIERMHTALPPVPEHGPD